MYAKIMDVEYNPTLPWPWRLHVPCYWTPEVTSMAPSLPCSSWKPSLLQRLLEGEMLDFGTGDAFFEFPIFCSFWWFEDWLFCIIPPFTLDRELSCSFNVSDHCCDKLFFVKFRLRSLSMIFLWGWWSVKDSFSSSMKLMSFPQKMISSMGHISIVRQFLRTQKALDQCNLYHIGKEREGEMVLPVPAGFFYSLGRIPARKETFR